MVRSIQSASLVHQWAMAEPWSTSYTAHMKSKLAEVIEAAQSLDADEREIAALALQSVDEAERAETESAWEETIDRRLDELASGKVKAVSGRETRTLGRALLAKRRG